MTSAGTDGPLFRIARPGDAVAIASVHDRSIRSAYRELIPETVLDTMEMGDRATRWLDWIADPDIDVLLREAEGRVVGFVSLCPTRDGDDDPTRVAEIPTLYVAPECWRERFGSDLLFAALGLARERGFQEVTLWVLEENRQARGFYETHGFHADGGVKRDPSIPEPELNAVRYRRGIRGCRGASKRRC